MFSLLAPILAQAISLNVGDRTDVRYIGGTDERVEAATRPTAGLSFGWARGSLTLTYAPSFTVTSLETSQRDLLVFQGAGVGATYQWRHTSIYVSEGLGYGDLTFRVNAISDPGVPTTNTPGAGPAIPAGNPGAPVGNPTPATIQATNQVRISGESVHYGSSTTTVGMSHQASRRVNVGANTGYTVGGGLGESRDKLPLVRGVIANAFVSHALTISRQDELTSTAAAQFGTSSLGNRVWGLLLNEGLSHKFDARTSARAGAGVGASLLSQENGLVAITIYPTFNGGILHFDKLGGGMLTLGATVNSAPYLDPLNGTIDPRLGTGVSAGWARDRFSIGVGAGGAISLAGSDGPGAINSVGASIGSGYRLGGGWSIDGGASTGWQTFEGATIIPASWAGFVGITWSSSLALNGNARH